MANDTVPRIVSAERMDGGVIVSFANGKSALFSTSLLYSVLPQATELPDEGTGLEPSVRD